MGIKVLLVDDDPAILQTMCGILRLQGLQVLTCSSAAEAIDRLAQDHFELVITDMRMEAPNAGCRVVRAATGQATPPVVIVLTAFPISENEARSMGAATVLLKGTSPGLLLQRVRDIIAKIRVCRSARPNRPPNRTAAKVS